ncbi:MAG: hypothetical protein JSU81_05795 [Candidatus Coatesbacteria bacterium]|nr:MAG: hypothetical protein JSU81_05795 [Candidatus Coatesbacteria bacterium]
MKTVLSIATAAALAAGGSWAGPGSVISSFQVSGGYDLAFSAYRDADYVYAIFQSPMFSYARIYSPAGSFVRESGVWWGRYVPEDADHSFLGPSYITLAVEKGVATYLKTGGAPVRWDHQNLIETLGYAHFPGSPYYYVGVWVDPHYTEYFIYRFSTGGSLISSFEPSYGFKLAATDRFAGAPGEYLIAYGGSPCGVYEPAGSLVATFNHEAGHSLYGGTAGPGYPASYGTTLWAMRFTYPYGVVYQIDLGNGSPSNLEPTSLGRVKALFR